MTGSGDGDRGGSSDFVAPESLYVHVPLCASKCSYCDFFSLPTAALPEGLEAELVASTLERARALSMRFGAERFNTVYIGGGTPTILSEHGLDSLLAGIASLAGRSESGSPREWTVEANPDSLGPRALEAMVKRGVTRLSLGVQSLDPVELSLLGRRHAPEAALNALVLGAEAGLSLSADLLAGIPESAASPRRPFDAEKLARYARELIDAGARHISVYDLTVEEGTPLANSRAGLRFPSEDETYEQRLALESALGAAGMRRYEVSNYSAKGEECLHNAAYWHMDSYIGAGPGAVSTLVLRSGASLRIEEPKTVEGYGEAACVAAETEIGLKDSAFESAMMAFRTSFGLDSEAFYRRFGSRAEDLFRVSLGAWRKRVVEGEPWPGSSESAGPALDGEGLDLLNRFLVDCLNEIDSKMAPREELR